MGVPPCPPTEDNAAPTAEDTPGVQANPLQGGEGHDPDLILFKAPLAKPDRPHSLGALKSEWLRPRKTSLRRRASMACLCRCFAAPAGPDCGCLPTFDYLCRWHLRQF